MRISPLISFLLVSVCTFAEGSREVAPNAVTIIGGNMTTDLAALHIDNNEYNNFASYTNPDPNSRLYIHVLDPDKECVFLGFSYGHSNQNVPNPISMSFEYRVVDPNGNIVFGPVTIGGPAEANISDWTSAVTGPMQIYGAGGYDAMQITSADLKSQGWSGEGDYYIEFDYPGNGTGLLIDFWDISVADCSQSVLVEEKGRIWSYNWSFFAVNDFGFPNRPFNGAFYVCAPDPDNPDAAFITKIDFNQAGFRPAAFNIAFNSFGTMNTGNVMTDRQSQQDMNLTRAEYAVFLNDPVDLCKTAEAGDIELLGISRCSAEDFCVKYVASKEGQIDLLFDFDGPDDIYTPGTADVMIAIDVPADQVNQPACIFWDGRDGLGNLLLEDAVTAIPVVISYAQGIYHFPIYDAEYMLNGFTIEAVRPAGPTPLLYYDDSNISVASGSGEPAMQLTGCMTPCHRWTVFNDANVPGFGNLNTINSWWFSQRILRSEVFFLPAYLSCAIAGQDQICEGQTLDLSWEPTVLPDGSDVPEVVWVAWSGPDIIGDPTGSVITIGSAGTYYVDVSWLTPLGDTCQTRCEQEITEIPTTYGTFDTLIISGDVIEINGELFSEGGQYVQVLTGSNGCDSILTIRISLLQTAVHFNLDACNSYPQIGTDSIYTEFTPEYPEPISCATLESTIAYRDHAGINRHSCTPGVDGSPAMCISSREACDYNPGDDKSFVFEITVTPASDTAVVISGLNFWERAPLMYDWINGPTGPNNYPTWYGVRVLKDGAEIFVQSGIATTNDWTFEAFDFLGNAAFTVDTVAVFRFELLGYCLVGNGEPVAAWDLDEISVVASCALTPQEVKMISGRIFTEDGRRIQEVEVLLSETADFEQAEMAISDGSGVFMFPDKPAGNGYYLHASKNSDYLEGVSTLDLIRIQKHLLGIQKFDSPFQYLAADATGNDAVSVLDLLDLRRLILGYFTALPGNTSWRFGRPGQALTTDAPWDFEETVHIPVLGKDLENVNFLAVKIGDVNQSDGHLSQDQVLSRSRSAVLLECDDVRMSKGILVRIPVTASEFNRINGFQGAWVLEHAEFQSVISGALDVHDAYLIGEDKKTLRMSWFDARGCSATADEVLFTLEILPFEDGALSAWMRDENTLRPEAYLDDYVRPLGWVFRNDKQIDGEQWIINQPNPFRAETQLVFSLSATGKVHIRVTDLGGRIVFQHSGEYLPGIHTLTFNGADFPIASQILICQMATENEILTTKMLITQ